MRAVSKAVAALADIRNKKLQPVPDGWFTRNDYQGEVGCGTASANKAMKALMDAGKLESQQWPIMDASGRINYTTIYRTK